MTEEDLKWTTDTHGNRVLRGLTLEETDFFLRYTKIDIEYRTTGKIERSATKFYREGKQRKVALNEKHGIAMFKARDTRNIK
jgi:hypothetical protein